MVQRKIWLLRLVLPMPYGRWLTGLLLFALLLPLFYIAGAQNSDDAVPALFFSLIIAYIIPIFSFITARSRESLLELRPILQLDDEAFSSALSQLDSSSTASTALTLLGGALAGFVHMSFVRGSSTILLQELFTNAERSMSTLGAMLVWIIMTCTITSLIQQSRLFARLGAQNAYVSLLNTRKLLPFARVSIYSSLAIIGAVALFPLIGFENGMNQVEILPGAIATIGPLVAIFVIPIWPIHCRLRDMKEQELETINDKIDACLSESQSSDSETQLLERLNPLLLYRTEVTRVSTWPFDFGNIARLILYMVIPPLTWVAAALIENVVDSLI